MDTSPVNSKNLWPTGKGRIEDGTSGRQKGFWDRARQGRFSWEDVKNAWYLNTGNQPCGKTQIRINGLF